jgi:hypothetical protein
MPPYSLHITDQGGWPDGYFETISKQLENGNRLVLTCGLHLDVIPRKMLMMSGRHYRDVHKDIIYIWLTNDERRKVLREIKKLTF